MKDLSDGLQADIPAATSQTRLTPEMHRDLVCAVPMGPVAMGSNLSPHKHR